MNVPRRKAKALDAPQTLEAATALVGRYADLITGAEEIRAAADHAIAQIEAGRDEMLAQIDVEAKDIFRQLSRWWAVSSNEVTAGVRKSVQIAGCLIGVRTATPSLKLPSGLTEKGVLAWLLEQAANGIDWADGCIRRTEKLDKQTIIKVLRLEQPSVATTALIDKGLATKQGETFFIDRPAKPATDDPETVDSGEGAVS